MAHALKNHSKDLRSWAWLVLGVLGLVSLCYGFDWVFAIGLPLLFFADPRTYEVKTSNVPSTPSFVKWGFGAAILIVLAAVVILGRRIADRNPEMSGPVGIALSGFIVVVIGGIAWAARIALIRRAAKRQEILKDL